MALILVRVNIPLEVPELEPRAVRELPFMFLLLILRAEEGEYCSCSSDYFFQLSELPADKDADSVLTVGRCVVEPVTKGTFSFSATPATAETDFKGGAGNKGTLRSVLRGPDNALLNHGHHLEEGISFPRSWSCSQMAVSAA